MQKRRKPSNSLPIWARVVGVVLGCLLILWSINFVRHLAGDLAMVLGVIFGLVVVVASVMPALRR